MPTKSEHPEAAAEAKLPAEPKPGVSSNMPPTEAAPAEEQPPTQIDKGSETAYSQERLIEDASPLTGYQSHEVAGALYGNTEEYLTVAETQKLVADWLETPVTAGEEA